jgi:uncharacterized protein (DUF58 family)
MHRLTLVRRLPSTLHAGTPFTEAVSLTNRKRLFPTVSLRMRTVVATSAVYVPYVPPRASTTLVLEGLYSKRGKVKVEPLELSSRYPFGLFERRRSEGTQETLIVFPHVEKIVPFFPERRGGVGDNAALMKGEGEDLFQIRDYVPGESARHIDWKATSRVQRLMTKDFHLNADLRITFILDASASTSNEVEALEREISLAASLIDFLHRRQSVYQLLTPAGSIPFGSGPRHYHDAMTHLALLRACDHQSGDLFCRRLSAAQIRDSIPIYFTARHTSLDLSFRAYRVLPAEPRNAAV